MPAFNTGNAAWDQGLGNLSGALFPDPSKVAQAGYYGAEQRKAQLESSKIRDQLARQQAADTAANTLTMPATSYAPSPEGPNMPPIMQPPTVAAAPSPAVAPPPPSLSATVAPGPAAAAPPPPAAPAPGPAAAAPAAGQVGANLGPAGLSGLFAGGGGAVAPAGNGTVRLDQGTPPPVSSPAPGAGAPPASNATASDGSVPNNDAVSGIFHPGSITPPDGGRKTTGPANADGSPSKPLITAAQWVNMQVAAGHDANQALVTWRAMISSAYDTGRIDENTYHHMMGAADPAIITTDATNAANIKRTGMEQAGQTQREAMSQTGQTTRTGMTEAGATTRTGMTIEEQDRARGDALVDTVDAAGNKTLTPRRDLKPGQPGYDPTLANTRLSATVAPVQVQPGGPGTSSYSMPAGQAQRDKVPLYQAGTEDERQRQQGTSVTVQPGGPGTATYSEPTSTAQQNRSPLYQPTSTDQFTAAQQQQIVNEKDPEKRRALIEGFTSAQTMAPKATDANESVRNSNIVNRQLQSQLPVPTIPLSQGGGMHTNTLPAGASPELETTLQNLTDQYFTYSPDKSIRGNRVGAADAAIQQLIRDKYIDPNQSRAGGWAPGSLTALTINKPVFNKDGSITQVPHFRVDIVDPKTGKPFPSGKAPTIPMAMSSVVAPAVAATKDQTPPAGALGPAPAGAADGTTGTTSTGQRGVVRGGWVFPAPGG